MADPTVLHATLLARRVDGLWQGLLLTGPSGTGKSDLALRMAAAGWWLVSDDRTVVWRDQDCLHGKAPVALTVLIELRGQGIVVLPRQAVVAIEASAVARLDLVFARQ